MSMIVSKSKFVSILKFFGFGGGEVRSDKKPLLVVYRDESNLRNAMLTIRMALNPGEVFNAEVAARIKREAAAYEEYLRNPKRVGWIVLYVKEFAGHGSHICVSREQLRIRQPLEGFPDSDEGGASFGYSFARSCNKVLEFVVHDENNEPLFPLVRTYTNWSIQKKELDLGLKRKFYLTLDDGIPGYVNLRAGFSPASVNETMVNFVSEQQRPAVASAANMFSMTGDSCYSLSFRQPANAVTFGAIMLIMLVSSLFVSRQVNVPNAQAKYPLNSSQANNSVPDFASESVLVTPIKVGTGAAAYSLANNLKMLPVQKKETLMRLADIRRFKVSVDKKSCEGRCLKLLDGIQRQLKSRLDGLNLPPAASKLVAVSKPTASLVVSYLPLDQERGNIHLTLSDHEGNLWGADLEHTVNADAQISDAQITDQYSEQFSTEVLLTIFRAKDQCLSEADKASTTTQELSK